MNNDSQHDVPFLFGRGKEIVCCYRCAIDYAAEESRQISLSFLQSDSRENLVFLYNVRLPLYEIRHLCSAVGMTLEKDTGFHYFPEDGGFALICDSPGPLADFFAVNLTLQGASHVQHCVSNSDVDVQTAMEFGYCLNIRGFCATRESLRRFHLDLSAALVAVTNLK